MNEYEDQIDVALLESSKKVLFKIFTYFPSVRVSLTIAVLTCFSERN